MDGDIYSLLIGGEKEVGAEFFDIAFRGYRDDSGDGIGEAGFDDGEAVLRVEGRDSLGEEDVDILYIGRAGIGGDDAA